MILSTVSGPVLGRRWPIWFPVEQPWPGLFLVSFWVPFWPNVVIWDQHVLTLANNMQAEMNSTKDFIPLLDVTNVRVVETDAKTEIFDDLEVVLSRTGEASSSV